MGSPEILDSGKRSNFSQACSLLSQFLKKGGTFGDLGRSLLYSADHKGIPTRAMVLLPMIERIRLPPQSLVGFPFSMPGGKNEEI